jgi:signal transduction histidine kinase
MWGRPRGASHGGDPASHPLAAGAAAFVASAAFFAAAAAAIPIRGLLPLIVLWCLVCSGVVVAAARRFGPQYGVPLAIAAGVAIDSFYVPPFRPYGWSDYWQNWLAMAVYLGMGTVIGGLAAGTRRRAGVSESARGELAGEQAALRRVATLVARGAEPAGVFAAVAEEVGRLFAAEAAGVVRYDDGGATAVGSWSNEEPRFWTGTAKLGGRNVTTLVHETGRPARVDGFDIDDSSDVTTTARSAGIWSAVGAPIVVDGRVWGALQIASVHEARLPTDTEARLANFAELAATAIANAEAQAELTASRARIVASSDETRRRIERDLHDGTQQRLVSLALRLRAAQAAVPPDGPELEAELEAVVAELDAALDELREFARGIHPPALTDGGLGPALRTLARRSPVPVEVDVRVEGRLPAQIEVATYFVVSETLANAAKHAQASRMAVEVDAENGALLLRVGDDGVGGAELGGGSGLAGLKDRVEALGGRLQLRSERGRGTSIAVELPLHDAGPDVRS